MSILWEFSFFPQVVKMLLYSTFVFESLLQPSDIVAPKFIFWSKLFCKYFTRINELLRFQSLHILGIIHTVWSYNISKSSRWFVINDFFSQKHPYIKTKCRNKTKMFWGYSYIENTILGIEWGHEGEWKQIELNMTE